jgi:MFS transporter, DHA1 family, tetracycline resistance protein
MISLYILYFAAFLDWVSYGLVYPMFSMLLFGQEPLFLASSSDAMRGFWLGAMIAASPLGQFFASPILGSLSDQIGRKLTLQLSCLVIVIGYLLSAFGIWEHNFFLLVLGRVVTGIGAGNISVINSSIADLSGPDNKTKNFAYLAMASGLGFTAGPFIGGKLSTWGFDIPFVFAGILTLGIFFIFVFLFKESLPKNKEPQTTLTMRLLRLTKLPSLPQFRIFFPAFLIFCFGWSFYWEFISVTWIKIYAFNVSQIGNFYAYGSAVYVLSSAFLVRYIAKRFKPMPILIGAWFILGGCLLLLIDAKIGAYWGAIPLQQILVSLIFPVGTTIVSNTVSADRQGEAMGIFQSLQSFAFAITPFLGGVLLNVSFRMPLIVSGIAMLVACFILFTGHKLRRTL